LNGHHKCHFGCKRIPLEQLSTIFLETTGGPAFLVSLSKSWKYFWIFTMNMKN